MKALKLLSIFVFGLFLLSTASAVAVYGDWQGSTQSATITEGDSIILNSDFISVNPPITLSIKLYDSSSNLIYSFENSRVVNNYSFFNSYELTETIYQNSGDYEVILTASDRVNSDSHTLNLRVNPIAVVDRTAPTITLVGANPISLNYGVAYTEYGATASDNVDGDVTGKIVITNPVNVYIAGNYTVRYNVVDSAGNAATEVTRTVIVLPSSVTTDVTAPVITLLGDNPINLTLGTPYAEYGATALDNVDGDITGKIVITNPVNRYVLGTYTVRYNVQDNAGNAATEVTRTVNIVNPSTTTDTTAPIITLLGESLVSVALGSTYTDAGATALDDVDGDITGKIVIVNPVNTNTVGTYTVRYNVQDNAGNAATEVTRVVGVYDPNDTTAPLITVITPQENKRYNKNITFEIKVNEIAEVEFSLNGQSRIAMNFAGIENGILTFTYTLQLEDGFHRVTFYAEDTNGNLANKTVDFTIGVSKDSSSKKKTTTGVTTFGEGNTEDNEYLNQFKKKDVIFLTEEDKTDSEKSSKLPSILKWFILGLVIFILLLVLLMLFLRR